MRQFDYSRALHIALIALSLAGVALLLFSTPHGGLGVTTDSVEYFAAARNLRTGHGWLRYGGLPYTAWPPLYSTSLMVAAEIGGLVGLAPIESARILHTLVYGLIIYFSGILFRKYMRSGLLALLATTAVFGSLPLLQATAFTWSESLFILMSLLLFLGLQRYTQHPTLRLLAPLIVITALACLQRYMGVTLVASGGLSILLFARAPLIRRFRDSVLFAVLSFAPLAVWLAYNAATTGNMAGPRPASAITTMEAASRASDTVLRWLFPHPYPSGYFPLGLLVVLAVCTALVIVALRRNNTDGHTQLSGFPPLSLRERGLGGEGIIPAIPALFVIVYPTMLLMFHSMISLNDIANRDLVPMYIYLIAVLFALIDRAAGWLSARTKRPSVVYAVAAVSVAVWLVAYPLVQTLNEVTAFRTWCCQLDQWNDMAMLHWLRENNLSETVYSNSTLPLYTLPMSKARFVGLLGSQQLFMQYAQPGELVAWFGDDAEDVCSPQGRYCHNTDYGLDEIVEQLQRVAALGESGIYQVIR
jgi:hypothetical protein